MYLNTMVDLDVAVKVTTIEDSASVASPPAGINSHWQWSNVGNVVHDGVLSIDSIDSICGIGKWYF